MLAISSLIAAIILIGMMIKDSILYRRLQKKEIMKNNNKYGRFVQHFKISPTLLVSLLFFLLVGLYLVLSVDAINSSEVSKYFDTSTDAYNIFRLEVVESTMIQEFKTTADTDRLIDLYVILKQHMTKLRLIHFMIIILLINLFSHLRKMRGYILLKTGVFNGKSLYPWKRVLNYSIVEIEYPEDDFVNKYKFIFRIPLTKIFKLIYRSEYSEVTFVLNYEPMQELVKILKDNNVEKLKR